MADQLLCFFLTPSLVFFHPFPWGEKKINFYFIFSIILMIKILFFQEFYRHPGVST